MTKTEWIRKYPIAHRGLHGSEYPENSMPAFEAAAAAGYGIELDVHLSADGRLVVMHDDDVKRMTGEEGVVADLDVATLRTYRLSGTTYTIPVLDDVLQVIDGRVPVLVEVKTGSPMAKAGPELVRALHGYRGPVAVQSFDPRVVLWLRRNAPDITRGQIASDFRSEELPAAQKILLRTMALNAVTRPHFIAYNVEAMPTVFVSLWRKVLRVPVLLWTVRNQAQADSAAEHRAMIIFEGFTPRQR